MKYLKLLKTAYFNFSFNLAIISLSSKDSAILYLSGYISFRFKWIYLLPQYHTYII
nr:MAG TPA: hypothetical protein [Caudoviricetes sp.]